MNKKLNEQVKESMNSLIDMANRVIEGCNNTDIAKDCDLTSLVCEEMSDLVEQISTTILTH